MHAVLWSVGEPGREIPMSAEENKALVRREQQELWHHTGNLDAAEELYAAEQPRPQGRRRQITAEASRMWQTLLRIS
jgi:hypothetical protein